MSIKVQFVHLGRLLRDVEYFDNFGALDTIRYAKTHGADKHRTREDDLLFDSGVWIQATMKN